MRALRMILVAGFLLSCVPVASAAPPTLPVVTTETGGYPPVAHTSTRAGDVAAWTTFHTTLHGPSRMSGACGTADAHAAPEIYHLAGCAYTWRTDDGCEDAVLRGHGTDGRDIITGMGGKIAMHLCYNVLSGYVCVVDQEGRLLLCAARVYYGWERHTYVETSPWGMEQRRVDIPLPILSAAPPGCPPFSTSPLRVGIRARQRGGATLHATRHRARLRHGPTAGRAGENLDTPGSAPVAGCARS